MSKGPMCPPSLHTVAEREYLHKVYVSDLTQDEIVIILEEYLGDHHIPDDLDFIEIADAILAKCIEKADKANACVCDSFTTCHCNKCSNAGNTEGVLS